MGYRQEEAGTFYALCLARFSLQAALVKRFFGSIKSIGWITRFWRREVNR